MTWEFYTGIRMPFVCIHHVRQFGYSASCRLCSIAKQCTSSISWNDHGHIYDSHQINFRSIVMFSLFSTSQRPRWWTHLVKHLNEIIYGILNSLLLWLLMQSPSELPWFNSAFHTHSHCGWTLTITTWSHRFLWIPIVSDIRRWFVPNLNRAFSTVSHCSNTVLCGSEITTFKLSLFVLQMRDRIYDQFYGMFSSEYYRRTLPVFSATPINSSLLWVAENWVQYSLITLDGLATIKFELGWTPKEIGCPDRRVAGFC